MYRILKREKFSDLIFMWEVLAPEVARSAQAGQFVMVRLHDGAERIPLTIADFDRDRGTITMVIQALGKTTNEMMTHYREGDEFLDFVGPLGLPQHVDKAGHVVMVGGGLGVGPVFPQLRAFKESGNRTGAIIGFRNKGLVFWEDRFAKYADDLVVCTDDGSYGEPGLVTAALDKMLKARKPDLVVAIGPLVMMQACTEVTRRHGVKTMVSLNTIMVDGTGMCGSCRVTVNKEVKFACVEGPDFDGHQVDFPELLARQRRYKSQESAASSDYSHVCNLEKQLFEEEKRNYKKIKELAPHQVPMPERNPAERATNFSEVNLGYTLKNALEEAERCLQCATPTCISGCPVQIDIPRFIRHVLVRDLDGALGVINESNLFPSICGRVCPQESQCEAQCIITKKVESVAIGRLERFVGDHAHAPPPVAQDPSTKLVHGRVAVVGSGPSGLACAADLVRYGADVTVYEALHTIGGVLRYGIPSFRLPRDIIDREVQRLTGMGVKFEANRVIGRTFTVADLLGPMGYDAAFLGVGAGAPAFLGIPGEFAGQVYSANEFLTRVNLMGSDNHSVADTPVHIGKSVVVVGAGNTAMDCLRVAKRLGTPKVRCVYRRTEAEVPARVEELRHAKEEGIEFLFLHSPVEIMTDVDNDVRGVRLQKMALGDPDEQGRRKPVPTNEFVEVECDTVIYALGTKANPIIAQSTPGLTFNKWGNIVADDATQATSLAGVFAGGDIVTGGATVILAMGAGRRAAKSIAAFLKNEKKNWPVTPHDLDVFDQQATAVRSSRPSGKPVAGIAGELCPRCHRPVEPGEESHVCCAGAAITWRCKSCAKIRDGFAFPFGACPSCGGELEVVDVAAPAASSASVEAIRIAFEIELGGRAFYRRAAADSAEPQLRELFEKFAAMEDEHIATLSRRYHLDAPALSPEFRTGHAAVYAGTIDEPKDPYNLFRIAIGFEKRAVEFFTRHAGTVKKGSAEHQLYRELAAEEQEHVDLLTTEYKRYQQGKPGLI